MQTKPSIVFVHGLWADGSCFSKLIQPLQAEGYEVMASQHSLDSVKGDVATVKRTLGRVSSPAILVGHSYGGTVITAAGTDDRVVGLVYIAALAPDENETSQGQQNQFPRRTSSLTSRSRTVASGCGRTASAASRETCPSRSRNWSGRRRWCRWPTSSIRRLKGPHGSRSRAGTSWPRKTAQSIPSWSGLPRSAWAPRRPRWTAATSRCSPTRNSCWM
jgi:pimeloyl-ACP methyl ester carboxylesterase